MERSSRSQCFSKRKTIGILDKYGQLAHGVGGRMADVWRGLGCGTELMNNCTAFYITNGQRINMTEWMPRGLYT